MDKANKQDVNYSELYPAGVDTGAKRVTLCWNPEHNDTNPSMHVNLHTGIYRCFSCGEAGNAREYITKYLKEDPKKYGVGKYVSEEIVSRHHQSLLRNPLPLLYLQVKRGISNDVIKKYRIGYDEESTRIVVPITDSSGRCTNLRKYLRESPEGEQKFLNLKGRGTPVLWPLHNLSEETVYLVAGELDLLVAESKGLNAVTCTAGETYWNEDWNKFFLNKDVNVIYDIDKTGRESSAKVCTQLLKYARTVRNIDITINGLDINDFPGGDLSDYFNELDPVPTVSDLKNLVKHTPVFRIDTEVKINEAAVEEVHDVDFTDALDSRYGDKVTKFICRVAGKDQVPYIIPKDILVECGETAGAVCASCTCVGKGGRYPHTFHPNDPRVLTFLRCTEDTLKANIKRLVGIPAKCTQHEIKQLAYANVEEVFLTKQVGTEQAVDDFSENEHVTRVGFNYYETKSMKWNTAYEVTSKTCREPVRGHSVHLISKAIPKEDDLQTFQLTKEDLETLKNVYAPTTQTFAGVEAKLSEIYEEYENSVTRIFGRRDLHLASDLPYHSVLSFIWNGKAVRGTLEVLLIGDTRQGKSDTIQGLRRFYKLGEKVDCSRATIPGLIGGAKELSNGHWTIEWGVLPVNDRRLVILEEVKNLSVEQIAALKELRSSGMAEVTAIRRDRTPARVRCVWIANPRSARKIASYSYGLESIRELIGDPENISRFDYACIVSEKDETVTSEVLQEAFRERLERDVKYGSDFGRKLVLYIWSRKTDEVCFGKNVEQTVQSLSGEITRRFDDSFPLVQETDFRYKLLRVAIAVAGRMASIDGNTIVVLPHHVEYAASLFYLLYEKPCFSYDVYSEDHRKANTLDGEERLENALSEAVSPDTLVAALISVNLFNRTQLGDWAGMEKEAITRLIHAMIASRAISSYDSSRYKKSPAFISFLRKFQGKLLRKKNDNGIARLQA